MTCGLRVGVQVVELVADRQVHRGVLAVVADQFGARLHQAQRPGRRPALRAEADLARGRSSSSPYSASLSGSAIWVKPSARSFSVTIRAAPRLLLALRTRTSDLARRRGRGAVQRVGLQRPDRAWSAGRRLGGRRGAMVGRRRVAVRGARRVAVRRHHLSQTIVATTPSITISMQRGQRPPLAIALWPAVPPSRSPTPPGPPPSGPRPLVHPVCSSLISLSVSASSAASGRPVGASCRD